MGSAASAVRRARPGKGLGGMTAKVNGLIPVAQAADMQRSVDFYKLLGLSVRDSRAGGLLLSRRPLGFTAEETYLGPLPPQTSCHSDRSGILGFLSRPHAGPDAFALRRVYGFNLRTRGWPILTSRSLRR